jgi:hypothetical protein
MFRKRYIDEYKLLSPTYNPEEIYVRSTDVNRTIMSAQSQLLGWYPDSNYLFLDEEIAQNAKPPMNIDNLADITNELKLDALPFDYQPVPIHVYDSKTDHLLLGYSTSVCPRLG